ncbi:MAG: hypothetical protein CVU19_19170 [Betaproteobacteria bacterium HGW-Betaproteobacteria-13]|jgi:hypothetical protein|uniref:DUF2946 domain-containing protein n=1 Tax=Parazoarcus communis TaxID=41977 RepID=A0A2U8H5N4_9RHOO|nr:DUF2946 domain-containing protein [Parazoarcus communis]AWI81252.1 hypothetical protein CEW87_18910 [Parazoarcus communis]PKO50358.1 MAG: hypothetical protein CVU28_13065 [Betaproteobacteria bacterium HGW-Betaproteobacteria-21]PKO79210.1 MAG: hypothetical protein CVU19_19170 [Betaproteobacteria bacterium HGW-Betaproteobacteria-13]
MVRRFRHQVLAARVAIFVILLSALMPVLGQALLRASDPARWTEICTTGGMILVDLSAEEGDDTPLESRSERNACPFCLPHAGHAAVLPELAPLVLEAVVDGSARFLQYSEHPRLRTVWLAAFSRGPPVTPALS